MRHLQRGFTLIELMTVVILVSIISVSVFSRLGSVESANLQASRDDIIAALFFAQQTAMARNNIQLVVTSNSVSVTENGTPIVVHSKGYPLALASGVSATVATLTYDKLGRTSATTIGLSSTSGVSASIVVEASGYAH